MVSFLKRYLLRLQQAEEVAGVGVNLLDQPEWEGPLFPRVRLWKKHWIPNRVDAPVSYKSVLTRLKKVATGLGIKKYGLHSSRRGAATTLVKASAEKGIDFADRMLQAAGRWAKGSSSAGDYIQELLLLTKGADIIKNSFN